MISNLRIRVHQNGIATVHNKNRREKILHHQKVYLWTIKIRKQIYQVIITIVMQGHLRQVILVHINPTQNRDVIVRQTADVVDL